MDEPDNFLLQLESSNGMVGDKQKSLLTKHDYPVYLCLS